ncbi:MAG: acyltransferase [Burkholderiales bacterium]|nr:acyltransferase [Burkholderiales bacterium]
MNRHFSIYLDLVRFLAAVLVYMYHSNQRWLTTDVLPLSNYGHSSVIVFFVLSGFVIAYVTDTKERDWISYGASRIARVYSVVIPALVLCLAADAIGRQIAPTHYDYPFNQFGLRILGSLLMLNEVWGVSITSFSNVPFWSITYEFWYYALFGVITFVRGRARWWLAGGLALLLGPKILLLAPLWAAGVALYHWRALHAITVGWAWVMTVGSAVAIVVLHGIGFFDAVTLGFKGLIGPKAHEQMTFSKFFIVDYLLGALVFCNFAGLRVVAGQLAPLLDRIEAPVKWLASYTFTLYLLHQPLFLFWGTVLRLDPAGRAAWLAVTAASAMSILVVGYVTENKRGALRRWVQRMLVRLARPTPTSQRA